MNDRIQMNVGRIKSWRRYVCFAISVLLIVIDWTRGSQAGEVWKWTVNMTGLVMVLLAVSVWGLKGFAKHKKVYLTWLLLGPIFGVVTYLFWWYHQRVGYRDQLVSAAIALWALGFLYIRLVYEVCLEKTRKVHFSISSGLLYLMLFLGFISVNEDVWPGFFLLIFFPIYQVLRDETQDNKAEIRRGLIDAVILMFFIIQGHAFMLRPFDDYHARYCGFYANSNMNALFYCIVYVAFLLRGMELKAKEKQTKGTVFLRLMCFLFAAAMWGFVFLTGCKTALLALIGVSVVFIVFGKIMLLKERAHILIGKIFVFLLIVVISVPIDYAAVRYLPPVFHHPIWFQGEYSEDKVHSWDPWDSYKYVSFDLFMKRMGKRYIPYLRYFGIDIEVQAAEVIMTSPADGNFASVTGRTDIWKYYLAHGKLFGRSNQEGHEITGDGYTWHTQNMFIQFWYYYGILAAIVFAAWLCFTGIKLIVDISRGLEKNRIENAESQYNRLITLCYLVLFGVYGIPEAVWYPGQFILFLACFLPALVQNSNRT